MTDTLGKAAQRLTQARELLVGKTQDPNKLPWDPESTSFPTRANLPRFPGAPEDAAWVWGKDDNRGRLNLLTPTRIKAAAAEIKTGETARLDLPLNVPEQPSFGRQKFQLSKKAVTPGLVYDDVYHMNTQSGTQWDGFRHFSHLTTQTFYNNTKAGDFDGESDNMKCSIHHWSKGGFCGRAVLLDYKSYAEANGIIYDTATSYGISYADLEACGKLQGIDIRPASQGGDIKIGDILCVRSGWTKDYYARTASENSQLGQRTGASTTWAGLKRDKATIDWLHDCYFAAVAGDAPAFEVWPPPRPGQPDHPGTTGSLHEYLLALWGVPIGEMLDLERVSELAREHRRSTFFLSSAPFNCPGGVSSYVNATAIF